jgi:hypothetical protein
MRNESLHLSVITTCSHEYQMLGFENAQNTHQVRLRFCNIRALAPRQTHSVRTRTLCFGGYTNAHGHRLSFPDTGVM